MSVSEELGAARQVALAGGVLRYRERGTGAAILFVHGLLVNGDLWRKVVPRLADRYRCITPDWPLGSHASPFSQAADLTPVGVAGIVAEAVGALSLRETTLVGNDSGGAVAQLVATRHPESIGRLVLTPCDAFDNFPPPMFRYLRPISRVPILMAAMAQTARLRPVQRLPITFGRLTRRPIEPAIMRSYLLPSRKDSRVRQDAARFLAGMIPSVTLRAAEDLRKIPHPTLVAWSRDDRVFPFRHAERLAETIPDARLEEIPGSYAFMPEDQPDRLADAIARFLGS